MSHLKYLNKFLWKYRTLLIIGTVFILTANIFALYPAEFVRKAFDTIVLNTSDNHINQNTVNVTSKIILKYTSLIILFSILKGIFMYFMRQTIIVMSRKIEFDLRGRGRANYCASKCNIK